MLTPKYLSDCPERMLELYAQLEMDILSDMARKIKAYEVFPSSANWQKERLRLMGETYEEILKRLSAATGKTVSELKALLQEAGIKTMASDDEIYRKAGKGITPLDASESVKRVLSAGLTKTANSFANLTKTTARNGSRQFVEALDRAYMQVTSGAFDTNTAIRNALKDLAGQGIISIRYKNRTDTIETAVRRAVVTGVSQTCGMLQEARADEMGCDLVEVTAHAGARPSHAEWQGKIYSRSGAHPNYPSLTEATGYGTAAGLKGVNCRHDFYPFIEGISEPAYSKEELKDYKESKDYTYNGEELSEYEATQKQRYIERQLRKYKRQQHTLKAAGFPADDAAAKVKHWNVVQEDFIRQTGLKRQYDREEIGTVKLNEKDKKALNDYISSKSYIINEQLRNETPLTIEDSEFTMDLDAALAKLPRYRGDLRRSLYFMDTDAMQTFLDMHRTGEKITYREYLSATRGETYNPEGQVQLRIANSTKGRNLAGFNDEEAEVLYERNASFRVGGTVNRNGKWFILLTEADE